MKIRLDAVIKNLSVANAAIKNTASPIAKDGWYPAFSASGQDVWLPDYRFDHRGIVVSAVGARCGKAFKADGKWNICANTHALSVDESIADRDYCWYILNNETYFSSAAIYAMHPNIRLQHVKSPSSGPCPRRRRRRTPCRRRIP